MSGRVGVMGTQYLHPAARRLCPAQCHCARRTHRQLELTRLMIERRRFLVATLVSAGALLARRAGASVPLGAGAARPPLTVYKDPSCGCCKAWIAHMEKSGF